MKKLKVVLAVAVVIAMVGAYTFPKVQQQLGAVPGFDFLNSVINFNGVRHEYRSTTFTGATSTPCSFISPASTSTLLFAGLQVRTGSSTATTWHLATSTIMNATTSPLTVPFSLASGAQGTFQFTGTSSVNGVFSEGRNSYDTLPPNSYVTWGFQGVSAYTNDKLVGTCQAEFIVH